MNDNAERTGLPDSGMRATLPEVDRGRGSERFATTANPRLSCPPGVRVYRAVSSDACRSDASRNDGNRGVTLHPLTNHATQRRPCVA